MNFRNILAFYQNRTLFVIPACPESAGINYNTPIPDAPDLFGIARMTVTAIFYNPNPDEPEPKRLKTLDFRL